MMSILAPTNLLSNPRHSLGMWNHFWKGQTPVILRKNWGRRNTDINHIITCMLADVNVHQSKIDNRTVYHLEISENGAQNKLLNMSRIYNDAILEFVKRTTKNEVDLQFSRNSYLR